jgi:hypothetical protein
VVDERSAVLLENTLTQQKRWITIEDDKPDAARNEFSSSSAIAQAVVGRRVGDEIDVPGQVVQPQKERILEIQSKYVRLFQDCIANFQHRFPGATSFQTLHLGAPDAFDASPLIETLKERRDRVNEITDHYQKHPCSIYLLASRLGITELQALKVLMWNDTWFIRCVNSTPHEFWERVEAGLPSKITLDMSAIITISHLNAWDCFETAKELYISRSTLEKIKEWLSDLSRDKATKTGHTSVDDADNFRIDDVTPEHLERQRAELEQIEEQLKKHCTLKDSIAISQLNPQRRELLVNALGYHTLEALNVAKDTGSILWTDDSVVAYVGQVDYGLSRTWTQIALRIIANSNPAFEKLFHNSTARLAAWNYVTTIWDAQSLLSAGQISGWDTKTWPFKQCIALLRSGPTSRQDRANIALQFFLLVRSSECSELLQSSVIHAVLDALGDIGGARWLLNSIDRACGFDVASAHFLKLHIQYWLRP